MMKKAKLSEKISYRVSEEEYKRIEREAMEGGISVNEWCRAAALERIADGQRGGAELKGSERMIYDEIARMRFLIVIGFGYLLTDDLNDEWNKALSEADERTDLSDRLLAKRRRTKE
jgi:hypothetical protein